MAPCTRLAFAWANRSTCSAELTDTICRCRAMSAGSFTVSVRSMRMPGLRSIQSYSSELPKANDAVTCAPGSSAPPLSRASTPSLNISDHTVRPRRLASAASTASGTAPMPSWSVAPSRTRAATRSPMSADVSEAGRGGGDGSGMSASIA